MKIKKWIKKNLIFFHLINIYLNYFNFHADNNFFSFFPEQNIYGYPAEIKMFP